MRPRYAGCCRKSSRQHRGAMLTALTCVPLREILWFLWLSLFRSTKSCRLTKTRLPHLVDSQSAQDGSKAPKPARSCTGPPFCNAPPEPSNPTALRWACRTWTKGIDAVLIPDQLHRTSSDSNQLTQISWPPRTSVLLRPRNLLKSHRISSHGAESTIPDPPGCIFTPLNSSGEEA